MSDTKVDFTLTVHEPDEDGNVWITSSVPGLHLCAPLEIALKRLPSMVRRLRQDNGDERARSLPRQAEWGDLYSGTGIDAFAVHRAVAIRSLFDAIKASASGDACDSQGKAG